VTLDRLLLRFEDALVIPDRVVEFLRGPSVMQVATRDAELWPAHAYVLGAIPHEDRQTVTFFVYEKRAKEILSDVEDNGRIALTLGQASHEAYQLKGTYLSSRPATEEDHALQEAYRDALYASLSQLWPEEVARKLVLGMAYRPGVAITFRVEDIYLQTPGPGAGERLS
jgi:hypothetical protein